MSYSFHLGRILETIGTLYLTTFSRFALLAVIAFVPTALTTCLFAWFFFVGGSVGQVFDMSMSSVALLVAASIAPLSFLYAAVTYGTLEELRGRQPDLRELIENGLALFLPMLGALSLFGLCVGLGLVVLVVPGVFAASVFWVALPAATEERCGALASLGRSFELTSGNSWSIFAIVFLLTGGCAVVYQFIALFGVVIGAGGDSWFGTVGTVLTMLMYWVAIALPMPIAAAVSYQAIRASKEGTGEIAAAYD